MLRISDAQDERSYATWRSSLQLAVYGRSQPYPNPLRSRERGL